MFYRLPTEQKQTALHNANDWILGCAFHSSMKLSAQVQISLVPCHAKQPWFKHSKYKPDGDY